MNVAIYTLGCKVNQYETQAMEAELERRGHVLVPFGGPADAYIINTCSVTAVADKKSRAAVRRARRRGGGAVVAVCGCYGQTHAGQAAELGADLLMGTGGHMALLDELERLVRQRPDAAPVLRVDDPFARRAFEPLSAGGLAGRTRALLKAEDGCANFCAYCIIPYARGPVRSLPLIDAEAEAARLAGEGYRELVLTGIELSSWGRDLEGRPPLAELIEGVCAAAPGLRVRLGSLEPRTVTEEFCRRCAGLPNLCPHFHLSLQSGCDDTLRRMKRRYDTRRYLESVELLRRFFPRCAVAADLITGFPGETEEEFSETLSFIQQCAFSSMHIFP
ncbi:MAG: MiaB/RimO family radical SAM methylthiotransferase, partial [Oscillospiraceae bacterium]|nr:MiaB/RimO family radical SAM methylthiotransferase [Oscillospiraceae bacterium]